MKANGQREKTWEWAPSPLLCPLRRLGQQQRIATAQRTIWHRRGGPRAFEPPRVVDGWQLVWPIEVEAPSAAQELCRGSFAAGSVR